MLHIWEESSPPCEHDRPSRSVFNPALPVLRPGLEPLPCASRTPHKTVIFRPWVSTCTPISCDLDALSCPFSFRFVCLAAHELLFLRWMPTKMANPHRRLTKPRDNQFDLRPLRLSLSKYGYTVRLDQQISSRGRIAITFIPIK
jgi:hypothetical protein